MNEDDIIRLALAANLLNYVDNETPRRYFIPADAGHDEVRYFAAFVAAAERKACAIACERISESLYKHDNETTARAAQDCADAILARG